MLYPVTSMYYESFLKPGLREEQRYVRRGGLSREYIALNHKIYG